METHSQILAKRNPNECPNCLKTGVMPFYRVSDIPVHSVLLMRSLELAKSYPRRNLELAHCPHCGFIFNAVFDPTVHEYSTSCEESQGFSPTFNEFSRSLAKRWVETYGLTGKTVLEIGCGKGEFLTQLVEYGAGSGIGIDPAFIPERLETPVSDRLRFIQDLYSESYSHLTADVICCRHTLEHIGPTHQLLSMIRQNIGDRKDTLLLFELPDVYRVLKEPAFWDIYYEHCSYFTAGSLARLFRLTGFDILELELEYDDQYIVIAAKPSNGNDQSPLPAEDDLALVAQEVDQFPSRFKEARKKWLSLLGKWKAASKKVALWGGGSKAVSFLTTLKLENHIDFVIDINPHKQGKFIPGTGHPVRGPASLPDDPPDCVILMNPIYQGEVKDMLDGMGLHPEITCA